MAPAASGERSVVRLSGGLVSRLSDATARSVARSGCGDGAEEASLRGAEELSFSRIGDEACGSASDVFSVVVLAGASTFAVNAADERGFEASILCIVAVAAATKFSLRDSGIVTDAFFAWSARRAA